MRNSAAKKVNSVPAIDRLLEETHMDTTRIEEPRTRKMVPIMAIARVAW